LCDGRILPSGNFLFPIVSPISFPAQDFCHSQNAPKTFCPRLNNTFPFPSVSTDLTDRAHKRVAIQKEKEEENKDDSENMVRCRFSPEAEEVTGNQFGAQLGAEAGSPFHSLNYPALIPRRKETCLIPALL
jgi:hypothetical protein